ncbi:MAG: FAD-dependent oxidoreductase [Actinocatenispora sp.]
MKKALVLGGSIAGLLAARVLADHADEVTIVERDDLDCGPAVRRGAPHSNQAHSLLGLGRITIEQLLPGTIRQLVRDGGQLLRGGGSQWFLDGRPKAVIKGGSIVSVTRPFLEWHIRRQVTDLDRVRVFRGSVSGLTMTGNRVDGALVLPPDATEPVRLDADLVVDATGRSSRLSDWLGRHDYPAPPKDRVQVDLGYATCLFDRPPGGRIGGYFAAHSAYTPSRATRGPSSVTPVEGNRWLVLVSGYGDDRPSTDPDDFAARCRADAAVPVQLVPDECVPVSDVAVHRFPASQRRDFHRLDRFPAGVIVAGDAVASFNPTYGQGMSSAAMHAAGIADWLGTGPDLAEPAYAYFQRIRPVLDDAWRTSAIQDLYLPHVDGPRPLGWRLRRGVSETVLAATVTDAAVHRAFLEVVNMTAGPGLLRRPGVLWRSARAGLRRRGVPAPEPAPALSERGA